ncbi:MAG: P-II family nitrogen regulator, partial [Gemmatimonadetes bacterium]|nr:P-II family nitrogen regulator [Gemmatimonadota bacterium]
MKLLKCIVRPNALEQVKEGLSALGIMGMTVSEVKGFGRQKGHKEVYRE